MKWNSKKCRCLICSEQGKTANFSSVVEGKSHVFVSHHIPFCECRKYLSTKSMMNNEKMGQDPNSPKN